MADSRVNTQYLVSPSKEVEEMWVDVRIQEKKSNIAAVKQAIEDLEKGKILELKAKQKMYEMELEHLIQSKKKNPDIIDV